MNNNAILPVVQQTPVNIVSIRKYCHYNFQHKLLLNLYCYKLLLLTSVQLVQVHLLLCNCVLVYIINETLSTVTVSLRYLGNKVWIKIIFTNKIYHYF